MPKTTNKQQKWKDIQVHEALKNRFTQLAARFTLSQVNLLEAMVSFFEKSGYDPRDMDIPSPSKQMRQFRNMMAAFMRKQEKDILLPLADKVALLLAKQAQTPPSHIGAGKALGDTSLGDTSLGDTSLGDPSLEAWQTRCQQLEMENAFLKKHLASITDEMEQSPEQVSGQIPEQFPGQVSKQVPTFPNES